MFAEFNQLGDAHLGGETVQSVALHYLAACACEEAFALSLEVAVYDVANDSVEDSVAKKFEALIVQWLSFLVAPGHTLVHQGELVELYPVWVETEDFVKSRTKLLVLAERKPHAVNEIINHHTS